MTRFTRPTAAKKPGLPPGTLIHTGPPRTEPVRIQVFNYAPDRFEEVEIQSVSDLAGLLHAPGVTWINIDGIHKTDLIERIGEIFSIHPLTLEDIVHTNQQPKLDDYETYLYIVLKMFYSNPEHEKIRAEQISLLLKENVLLSFQETPADVFEAVRERLRKRKGRIRGAGADYLAYALIDAVVDHYFVTLEAIEERMEILEEEILVRPDAGTPEAIHDLKREMIFLWRQVWPFRGILQAMKREGPPLVQESTRIFLDDVNDHAAQVMNTIDSFRDILSGMLDLYLSTASNRMNEVMKVLTVIATIFIPLTFIAGVYGMNFEYMPELQWRWGYFTVWGVMIGITVGMLIYFKRNDWL